MLIHPLEASSKLRLRHDCYMILIGHLQGRAHIKMLDKLVAAREDRIEKTAEDSAEFTVLNSEEMECILEHVNLNADAERLNDERESHFVYEDNSNPSLTEAVKRNASFEKLKTVCRKYETRKELDPEKAMFQHERRTQQSVPYFREKGLSPDETQAVSFVISFYTGTRSEILNRGASLIARHRNGQNIDEAKKTRTDRGSYYPLLFGERFITYSISHVALFFVIPPVTDRSIDYRWLTPLFGITTV
ncbi:unnamed protein product [Didymodactylos carnosus]|uniref:Uncharacterized protein n=1 Tax=Didymodactylos carnosus TaxID=1234261 RepID=A0A814VY68_9BILA|nr:unnamed protein product [Didymodactylos carnosus]CAF1193994.1 unnamed protein product [Didymodactylos carnosus]CAF3901473.1 unnamed protein product [Didymodactylos carnosus]CAF3958324.1 unnamed protein product [Didymodactylos carnosus]